MASSITHETPFNSNKENIVPGVAEKHAVSQPAPPITIFKATAEAVKDPLPATYKDVLEKMQNVEAHIQELYGPEVIIAHYSEEHYGMMKILFRAKNRVQKQYKRKEDFPTSIFKATRARLQSWMNRFRALEKMANPAYDTIIAEAEKEGLDADEAYLILKRALNVLYGIFTEAQCASKHGKRIFSAWDVARDQVKDPKDKVLHEILGEFFAFVDLEMKDWNLEDRKKKKAGSGESVQGAQVAGRKRRAGEDEEPRQSKRQK